MELAKQHTDRTVVLKRPYYVPVHPSAHRTYKAIATHYDVFQVNFSPNNPVEIIELEDEENEIKEK